MDTSVCPNCKQEKPDTKEICDCCNEKAYLSSEGWGSNQVQSDMDYCEAKTDVRKYAGFWKRALAIIIDSMIISTILFFLKTSVVSVLFSVVFNWLYFALQESSEKQATIGKRLLKIKVTDLEGNKIGFALATGRYFAKILSVLTLFVGYFMAAFTPKKQAMHDMIAKTLVVNENY